MQKTNDLLKEVSHDLNASLLFLKLLFKKKRCLNELPAPPMNIGYWSMIFTLFISLEV